MSARSPFSARSFADRAAARKAAQEGPAASEAGDPPTGIREGKVLTTKPPAGTARKVRDAATPGAEALARDGYAARPAPSDIQVPPLAPPSETVASLRVPVGMAEAPGRFGQAPARLRRLEPKPEAGPTSGTGLERAPAPPRAAFAGPSATPPEGALRLVPLQALSKGGRWRTEAMRSYRTPLLLWFTRGQGRITIAGLKRGYGAHNAVFIPPGTMHGFEVTAQVYGTAVFFADALDLPLPAAPLHLRVRDGIAQGEVTTILEQLGREIDNDRPERARAIHHHAGLLSVWLDRQRALADDAPPDTAALRLVRRFTDLVEAQLYTAQNVSDYAEALGVTPTHLSRVCRETCGRSASDILADRLTFEARRLLAETTLPVKQVARLLGYGSAAYFTRAFQNRTGQTPTQFRAAA